MLKALGAALYVPATHQHLMELADGQRLPHVRTLIFCTEDAVAERDLSYALFNLSVALANMRATSSTARFVRVRSMAVLERVLAMPGADKLDGFVIPKATRHNLGGYWQLVRDTGHLLMPTLETVEVFDDSEMQLLRRLLQAPELAPRILALRIGGNDLLALLGLRRPRHLTLYRTPLGPVIARLATTFAPHGFALTAPVFEHLDLPELLAQEVAEDLAHGLSGKTAIHPSQVAPIEAHYRVTRADLQSAEAILAPDCPAVFAMHDSMCEVATHRRWAERTVEQARLFGVHAEPRHCPPPALQSGS
jgi:citrate lyase beta subunit